ncbi:unnamed protein product [Rhodiola kirilowii]
MVEELAAFERTGTWEVVPFHLMFVLSLVSGSIQ